MKLKIGDRVKNKTGLVDEGTVTYVYLDDKHVNVRWHYQDGFEMSEHWPIKDLTKVKPTRCPTCGRTL